jgi:hypothetical protein
MGGLHDMPGEDATMARVIPLRHVLINLLVMIASFVWLFFAGRWSEALLHSPGHSAGAGWLAVALAVLGVVPWMYYIAWAVALGDEYVRHVVLVGTSLAFVVAILAHIAFNTMVDARFVARDVYPPELVFGIGAWAVGCAISILYYRQRP